MSVSKLGRVAAVLAAIFFFALPAASQADSLTLRQTAISLTGLGNAVVPNIDVQATCTTTISGMAAGDVVTFEGAGNGAPNLNQAGPTPDTSTYSPVNATTFMGGAAASTSSANGLFVSSVAGLTSFRARVSTYVSGTIGLVVTCSTAQFYPIK